jgi:FkbM family methyltransferase
MIKKLLKKSIQKFGYDIIQKKLCMADFKKIKTNAELNTLEVLVQLELCENDHFNFIHVGANDGQKSDPLYEIIKKYEISGILLEPVPETFERLRSNYANSSLVKKKKLILENIALTPEGDSGDISFYEFCDITPDDKDNLSGYSTTDKNKLIGIRESLGVDNQIREIKVDYESVPFFLNKRGLNNISLLVLDAEGMDIDILMSFLKCKNFPNIIYMEILDQSCDRIMETVNELIDSGYRIGGDQSDLIAYRELN